MQEQRYVNNIVELLLISILYFNVNYSSLYFIWRYFLSSLPSVKMFPFFTINSIVKKDKKTKRINKINCSNFLVQKNNLLFPLCAVLYWEPINRSIAFAQSRFLFCMTTCFNPTASNIYRSFPKTLFSWNKAFFTCSKNPVGTTAIFCHTTIINLSHTQR